MNTSAEVVIRKRGALRAYLSCIRYEDVLVLQGAPLLGLALGFHELSADTVLQGLVFVVASLLLVAHIFAFNDWAGIASDANDPNKSAGVFLTRGISPREVAGLSLVLLAASLGLFAVLRVQTLLLAVAIAALGALYSHPAVNAKGIPVASSLPHLVGGLLHFLLGYSLWSGVDARGTLVGLFFALTFTAGHLNQEVRDHDGDRANGLRTNAVAFGKTAAFAAGLALFTLAYADLLLLARLGLVPRIAGWLVPALYPIHLAWTVGTLRAGLDFDSVSRFQTRYRLLYAVIGAVMLAAILLG